MKPLAITETQAREVVGSTACMQDGDRLSGPFSKDKVKDSPNVDIDAGHLDEADEQRLYDYYGMASSPATRRPASVRRSMRR